MNDLFDSVFYLQPWLCFISNVGHEEYACWIYKLEMKEHILDILYNLYLENNICLSVTVIFSDSTREKKSEVVKSEDIRQRRPSIIWP